MTCFLFSIAFFVWPIIPFFKYPIGKCELHALSVVTERFYFSSFKEMAPVKYNKLSGVTFFKSVKSTGIFSY